MPSLGFCVQEPTRIRIVHPKPAVAAAPAPTKESATSANNPRRRVFRVKVKEPTVAAMVRRLKGV